MSHPWTKEIGRQRQQCAPEHSPVVDSLYTLKSGEDSHRDEVDIVSIVWSLIDYVDCPTLENFGWLALETVS